MSGAFWTELALTVLAAIGAITLHEAAHGYAAWALGDDTARRLGRLSLNPSATSTGWAPSCCRGSCSSCSC